MPVKKIKRRNKRRPKKKVLTLFSKEELGHFEKLRKDVYENEGATQPDYLPFEIVPNIYHPFSASLPIGFFPCSSSFPYMYGDVLEWITTNEPDYATLDEASTNRFIKRFTDDGNSDHIIHAIKHLGARAFWCPVIIRIIGCLESKYKYAIYNGDKNLREEIEIMAQNIGFAFLHRTTPSKEIKQNKIPILFRKLYVPKDQRKGQLSTEDNKLLYILRNYEEDKKKSKRSHKKTAGLLPKLQEHLNDINTKIIQISKKTGPDDLQKLEKERDSLKLTITKLEKEENQAHREARKKTIDRLVRETGIPISIRSFEKILAIANDLKLAYQL